MVTTLRFTVGCAAVMLMALSSGAVRADEADTDGDGFSDAIEKALGTDPNNAASTPTGKAAGQAKDITKAGARVFLDFTNTQFDSITVFGNIDAPALSTVSGQTIAVDLGGFVQVFMLDDNGHAQTPLGIIDVRQHKSGTGVHFLMTAQAADLETLYLSGGLDSGDETLKAVSLDLTIIAGKAKYFVTLPGLYNAKANKFGRAFLGTISDDAKITKPKVRIESVKVTPSPATANQAVTFKGTVSIKDLTGDVNGHLAFGDDTQPVRVDGPTLQTMLKTGIAHTYTADGVYEARLAFSGDNEVLVTRLYVVVGRNFIVNPLNGSVSKLVKDGNGSVTLTHLVGHVPNATSAMTTFKDLNGNPIGVPRETSTAAGARAVAPPNPADPQVGLTVSRVFTLPGVFVAEITPLDPNNKPMGKLRKTITISRSDVGTSGAEAAARADGTTDGVIDLTSISGKFLFTSSKQDKVLFTGTFTLPVGYNPTVTGGNDISIGMGNVVDTVHLNEKSKAELPTTLGRITKFTLRVPKLPSGTATGTEVAKVSMTMNIADLDILGFDSEGITASVRSDEGDQTAVARYVQVDMLVGGSTFTVLSSVDYKLDSNSEFGTIAGRK